MSNTIGDYVNLDNSTLPKNTPHDLVVDVYTLPSFDNGRAPERKRVRELISINSIVTPDTILFNKLNVRFKRIWDIRSATVMSLCSNEFLRLKTTNLDDSYLYYLLHSDYITNYLVNASGGSSGSHSRISPGDLLSIPISPPNIEEQKNIARLLSILDDKIELNRKINAELEQMACTLYDYWFVQFDFPDANGKPYKSSGGQMSYSNQLKREIPTGWLALKLQDALEFEKGTEPGAAAYSEVKNDEYDLPFYRVGDINGETSTYINSSKFNAKVVKPTDVIVT
ncbi:restriction endonuclease subunit S, partial [Candidatus Saccharibacteria bacterium]|nr:restriction endonuclease subunit S [Candidatus Saccharibacteria bacterium]